MAGNQTRKARIPQFRVGTHRRHYTMSLQPRRMLSLWHAGVAAGCAAPEFVPRFDPPIAPASLAELPPLPSGATLSLQQRALLGSGSVGLGGRRWPAAATLCRYLLEHRAELVHQRRVLEIGCGGGAVGIYAAALGAASVSLTDGGGEALLELASANVRRNEEVLARMGCATSAWQSTLGPPAKKRARGCA